MTSPVAVLAATLQGRMSGGEFSSFFDDERRRNVLRGLFESYYANHQDIIRTGSTPLNSGEQIIFDTNRSWTGRLPLIKQLYPQAKIICCVREIGQIVDSIERMLAKNPLHLSRIFSFKPGSSVYGRTELLMNSEQGLIGLPWSTLREAWYSELASSLIVIPYANLAKYPEKTITALYTQLGEPLFKHDFNQVQYEEPDYDEELGMPGMHTVKSKVEYLEQKPTIPPDLFAKYASTQFWEKKELNTRGVVIL
jgi:sulfotransferase